MNAPKVSDIIGIINKKFPFALAEQWDNTGFQLGDAAAPADSIMVALDPLPSVIEQALANQCRLLITHHPLIFSPLRQITTATAIGRLLLRAATGGLALLSMHTNYDIARDGLNDLLAARIGLQDIRPLKITGHDELVKFVVFVPTDHLEAVREALFEHAASLGNYRNCSFAASGTGTFLPLAGAQPAFGSVGALEAVAEHRLELLVHKDRLPRLIRTLRSVHPYEEPAFDSYPLLNDAPVVGLGRIGPLAEPQHLEALAQQVARDLGCPTVRTVGDPSRPVRTVAVCGGSGASLLREAARAGADVLITGDVKYHDAREAQTLGVALLDAGHFGTERLMVAAVTSFLEDSLARNGFAAVVTAANTETDPFTTVQASP